MKATGAPVTFDDIPQGAAIFIDANLLVYAFTLDPTYGPACQRLLNRIENGDFQGFTSAHVVSEVSHRLMTLEAIALFSRSATGMANWLRRPPAEVQQLRRHRQAIDELTLVPATILPVSGSNVSRAADLSIQHGLLTNDALIVAVMQAHGLTHLASHDADFDRVPGLSRYAPV